MKNENVASGKGGAYLPRLDNPRFANDRSVQKDFKTEDFLNEEPGHPAFVAGDTRNGYKFGHFY